MNVLQVIPELDAGGAERTTLDIAAAVAAQGGRALVASRGGRLEDELAALGGELVRLPMQTKNPFTLLANVKKLADLAAANAIDIIHARSRAPAWSALRAARTAGCGFVTTYHGTYNAKSDLKRWYNSVMARGDVVIANSQFIADRIRAEHGDLARSIVVIPRGLDMAKLNEAAVGAERVSALRAAWGVAADETRPIVVMPGRLTRWKGQLAMIAAFARLASSEGAGEKPNALLVMPGDDQGRAEYRAELESAITARGLRGGVVLPGHCADMPAAYALADIVVSASIEPEAFGRVAAEGQAMGRPVIATDHGGARETVQNGVTGRLVAPDDADAMAEALRAILEMSTDARAAMGAAGAKRARTLFSVEAMQAATLRVYENVVGRGMSGRT